MFSLIMNIAMWIAGWTLGVHILTSKKDYEEPMREYYVSKIISWTVVWVWICWKFIT